ncbi:response regulator [Noviherbaspirillum cavernae]|nr:response regulator [Noviherbaspirillum cavernae]
MTIFLKTGTPSQSAGMLPFAGRRILVADDNPVNQKLAVRMLEKLGCLAAVADNGAIAARMHASQPYDLVLMDCQMPELDGYQATARIREHDRGQRHTPIVALTSATGPAEREKCAASGMDDFLAKPVQPQVLKNMLGRWLPPPAPLAQDNLEAVHAMFRDDFAELTALYQSDSPKRIDLMREAAAAQDHAQVARIAHSFSGSCASIGAAGLCALCKDLELHARTGALHDIDRRLAAIEAEYARVSAKLQAMLAAP